MYKVFVNGSFDVIHVGHIRLLEYAKSFPNSFVYVLIDSDRRIREKKGKDRPINNEYERASLLAALKAVDKVDIFDTDEELEYYIKNYSPDLMVKGSDYQDQPIIGREWCKNIYFYDRLAKYSTTAKIQSIIDR